MGVSGADHDIARLDPSRLLNSCPRLISDLPPDTDEIQHHQSGALPARFDDQCLAIKRVENTVGAALMIITCQRDAQWWSDVGERRPHAAIGGQILQSNARNPDNERERRRIHGTASFLSKMRLNPQAPDA